MKTKFRKSVIAIGGAVVVSLGYIVGLHAQPSSPTPAKPTLTTNWVGCLVAGRNDTIDAIAVGGPHPTVKPEVEIGLRSDGVLVWRKLVK